MQAVRLTENGHFGLAEVARPEPGPGEILVRVEACGICGSDRHMVRGEYPTSRPVTLGHEFAGRIEQVGAGVTRLAAGDRVTGDPNIACGTCPACRAGRVNLCETLSAIGVNQDGGFADYLVMPEIQAYKLPEGMKAEHGAFCEPLACCLHGLDVARIAPGMRVAVLGGGVIGLLMVQLARLAGAADVTLVTRQAARRSLALAVGATTAFDPSAADPVAALTAPEGAAPGGFDVVLECAGVAATFTQSLALVRRGGTVVVFGVMPAGETVPVTPFDLLVREVRLEGAYLNPMTHGRAVAMIASGVLALDPLISRRIPLKDVAETVLAPPAPGEIKVVAVPGLG